MAILVNFLLKFYLRWRLVFIIFTRGRNFDWSIINVGTFWSRYLRINTWFQAKVISAGYNQHGLSNLVCVRLKWILDPKIHNANFLNLLLFYFQSSNKTSFFQILTLTSTVSIFIFSNRRTICSWDQILWIERSRLTTSLSWTNSFYWQVQIEDLSVVQLITNVVQFFLAIHYIFPCYGNASTRKRLNTEMPQKKSGNPSKILGNASK